MKKHSQFILYMFLILSVVLLFAFMMGKISESADDESLFVLNDGWTFSLNNEKLETTSVDELNVNLKKGDALELRRVLPGDSVKLATLRIFIGYSTVSVFLDNEDIFNYGFELLDTYGFIPEGYRLLSLPDGYEGKELVIRYVAGEDKAFSGLSAPLLGSVDSVVRYWIYEKNVAIYSGIFLLIFGFIMTLISFFNYIFYGEKPKSVYGGILTINIALMALTYTDSFFFITTNLLATELIEYYSQFFLLVSVAGLGRTFPVGRKTHMFFTAVYRLAFVSVFAATFLQFRKMMPLNTYLVYYQRVAAVISAIMFLLILPFLINSFSYHREKIKVKGNIDISELSNNLLYLSFLTLDFFVALEIAFYQIFKYVLGRDSVYNYSMFLIGVIIFAVLIFLSYLLNDVAVMRDKNNQDRLEKMAYSDSLTGLYNRTYADMVLEKLLGAGMPFSVIMMDVNHLKALNDSSGHETGDEYLRAFSQILTEKFRKADKLCRTGGDEFIVIMNKGNTVMCEDRIAEFLEYMNLINSKKIYPFSFSVAVGYCVSSEIKSTDPLDVYSLADKRMYENKREYRLESTR